MNSLSRLRNPVILQLKPLVDDPKAWIRSRAISLLGDSRDPNAFEIVLHCLDDPDDHVFYTAICALGRLGDLRAIPYLRILADHYQNDSNSLGHAARIALTKLGIHHRSGTGYE